MNFLIADTFTDSLARLTGDEQKAVKTTAFDLQVNPANPGMSFHKLAKAKDKNFWSVRVNADIRLIIDKRQRSLGHAEQRHVTPTREAEVGAHCRQSHQPSGGRGDESFQDSVIWYSVTHHERVRIETSERTDC
jgi:mRNA-degrading endonuclease RelE of RelBE toxin-antitoxin system